jgi:hypothetical protein
MTILKTQTSSNPRLQNDTLGDDALKELYNAYSAMSKENFKIFAEGVVMAGGGKQPMKLAIIDQMNRPNVSKEFILTKAQNFILAGMGLGV